MNFSKIPDQKGVLDMSRGLPDYDLISGNNKVWLGTGALQCLIFF
jgi:hypothetical protein